MRRASDISRPSPGGTLTVLTLVAIGALWPMPLSASALLALALALAAVAIPGASAPGMLIPASRRPQKHRSPARAPADSLLLASFFLLVILVTATMTITIDSRHVGDMVVTTLVEVSGPQALRACSSAEQGWRQDAISAIRTAFTQ